MMVFVFLFGLAVGSFLNAALYRLKKGERVVKGRSYCPHCKHQLAWYDLVPLLSYILLKGRCRYCAKVISIQYPTVELAVGLMFVLFVAQAESTLSLLYLWTIASLLVFVFVYDVKHYLIPDVVVYPGIVLAFVWQVSQGTLVPALLSALGAAGFFAAIYVLSKGKWMGLGDAKLALLMGLFLSFPNILVALFVAFLTGAIVGVALVLYGKKAMKSEVPFGPFLVAGTFLAYFLGDALVDYYLSFLLI